MLPMNTPRAILATSPKNPQSLSVCCRLYMPSPFLRIIGAHAAEALTRDSRVYQRRAGGMPGQAARHA
ncbi:hypothetical protein PO78_4292 [Thauera sp. SWB20]|nr:hypothetical protein PO78_4292 [Thauera sp. SWB20]